MAILLIGGAGYIGSHTVVKLLDAGEKIIVVDNFLNSKANTIDKMKKITRKNFLFYNVNYLNNEEIEEVFKQNIDIKEVIHFAGLKTCVKDPLIYYKNNINGTLNLLQIMKRHNVKNFIFSSSASVYGIPEKLPLTEECKIGNTTNAYATSKYITEKILQDLYCSDNSWNIGILRYFNPMGAHESKLLGEEISRKVDNLILCIIKVAKGDSEELTIFGQDYPTCDGTAVRDYIHIEDLAKGNLKAIEKLRKEKNGLHIYNFGTGKGYSVLQVIKVFEKITGKKIPYKIANRRKSDVAICYSDSTKAKKELNWEAEKTLEDMCYSAWNYEKERNVIKNEK